jgi:iron(III) transport system substrate-binding protein
MKLLLSSILLLFVLSCSKKESHEVVVYTTVDQIFSQPILEDFEKRSGIKIKAIFDTEETKSTGVLNRIIAEKNNPQCDVFWSGDPIRAIILKNRGITMGYNSPNAKNIKSHFKDSQSHWIGFSARARVLIYNNDLVKPQDVPKSIFDLLDRKYKGQFAIANPLFGTTSFHFASWFSAFGDEKAKELLDGFKNNKVVIATSNGDVKKRVLNGEIWCGLTDSDDAFIAMNESKNIDIVFLDQEGIGNLIIPNTVSLIKNSPNNKNGKKLIDYLLSKETERKLAISCAQMPLHVGVKTPDNVPSLDNIVSMKIDYDKTAKKLEEIQKYLKKWTEH